VRSPETLIGYTCRENEQLSKYGDTKAARNIMLLELKKLIEANPLFRDKLAFPGLKASRLRTLINQRSSRISCLAKLSIPYNPCPEPWIWYQSSNRNLWGVDNFNHFVLCVEAFWFLTVSSQFLFVVFGSFLRTFCYLLIIEICCRSIVSGLLASWY